MELRALGSRPSHAQWITERSKEQAENRRKQAERRRRHGRRAQKESSDHATTDDTTTSVAVTPNVTSSHEQGKRSFVIRDTALVTSNL